MVDLPPGVLRAVFDRELVRGALFRLDDYKLSTGTVRDKFFVVLNVDCSGPLIYHALTTSKIQRYQSLPFAGDGIFVPIGGHPELRRDTIVDGHTLPQPFGREALFEEYRRGRLRILAPLADAFMAEIDRVIASSRLIPPAIKLTILPRPGPPRSPHT